MQTLAESLRASHWGKNLTAEEFDKANHGSNDYAVLKIKPSAPLSDPEAAEVMAIRAQFAELVRRMGVDAEDYGGDEVTAPYVQEPADTPF